MDGWIQLLYYILDISIHIAYLQRYLLTYFFPFLTFLITTATQSAGVIHGRYSVVNEIPH